MISRHTAKCGDRILSYRLRIRQGIRHCYLRIVGNEVELRCPPRLSRDEAEAILCRHRKWILEKLEISARRREFDIHKGFLLEGRLYPFHHVSESSGKVRAALQEECLKISAPLPPDGETLRNLYESLYRRHCHEAIVSRVETWSRNMGLSPTRIGFRRARTRWGSCSARNSISLNLYLAALPRQLSDYVIVHELAHIRHKNHSEAFWNLVEKYLPDWKIRRRKLREYEKILPAAG